MLVDAPESISLCPSMALRSWLTALGATLALHELGRHYGGLIDGRLYEVDDVMSFQRMKD